MIRIGRMARIAVFAATVSQATCHVAVAQREEGRRAPEGRRFGGGFSSPTLRLATHEKVQEVLKLSDDQRTEIEEVNKQFRKDFRRMLEDRDGLEGVWKLSEDTAAKLAEILDDEQRKRLQEIAIQAYGAATVLFEPMLAKVLDVSHEQKAGMGEVQHLAMREGFRELRSVSRDERRDKMEELRAKVDKKLLDALSAEQREKLDSLKGEKVNIDYSELRGPGLGFFGGRSRGERGERDRGDRDRNDSDDDGDKSA